MIINSGGNLRQECFDLLANLFCWFLRIKKGVLPILLLLLCIHEPYAYAIPENKKGNSDATTCEKISPPNMRGLRGDKKEEIAKIIASVESLEAKGEYEKAAQKYSLVKNILFEIEGECSLNSARVRLVYGTKLFRAFRLEESEQEIKSGLAMLKIANVASKETCEEYTGGLKFLDEIYGNKSENRSYASDFLESVQFLRECQITRQEEMKPIMFDLLLRLSSSFFFGYASRDQTESLRQKQLELAFDALNQAFAVVDGKPTDMQYAALLKKEGYFNYVIAGVSNDVSRKGDLLIRAKEATAMAMKIQYENNRFKQSNGSAMQLAYILEELEEYEEANIVYRRLIEESLTKPLNAINLSNNHNLLTGYALFAKNWGKAREFKDALQLLMRWESLAVQSLLPSLSANERLQYLNRFSQSDGVASRARLSGLITPGDRLDAFLQLRYSLIEAELIALQRNGLISADSSSSNATSLAERINLLNIDYSDRARKLLDQSDVFIQFVDASPDGYSSRIPQSEIEDNAQAFVVRPGQESEDVDVVSLCESSICSSLIAAALNASTEGLSDAVEKWSLVMDQIFPEKLVRMIREADTVFIGLDGPLQRVPIGIIRRYLKSRSVDSTRFILVQNINDIGVSARNLEGNDSFVFYSPDYGSTPKCDSGRMCREQWPELPHSLAEGRAVSKLLKANQLFGADASKSALLSIKRPKLLHISTHAGFRSSADEGKVDEPNNIVKSQILDGLYNLYVVASGANVLPSSRSLLTYKDLAGLDLNGTNLVVISACESGLGSSIRGYGLFGMHRIFASVGAGSTLLSMWKVDDEATSEFMKLFYEELDKGVSLDIALAVAQDRMVMDEKYKSRGWSHPYYWAGWQVAGNMSPIPAAAN